MRVYKNSIKQKKFASQHSAIIYYICAFKSSLQIWVFDKLIKSKPTVKSTIRCRFMWVYPFPSLQSPVCPRRVKGKGRVCSALHHALCPVDLETVGKTSDGARILLLFIQILWASPSRKHLDFLRTDRSAWDLSSVTRLRRSAGPEFRNTLGEHHPLLAMW